jgi:NADH-quinone oxidoreductase subunit J
MTLHAILFYILAGLILGTTTLAVTRRNLVHAVVYLVLSFFGTAMLFYLFGAPLLAALEVIIYAGAIMVLFLFIIMMIRVDRAPDPLFPRRQGLPALMVALAYLAVGGLMLRAGTPDEGALATAVAEPQAFGLFLFQRHWLAVEIVSLLLLVALVGALHLSRRAGTEDDEEEGAA